MEYTNIGLVAHAKKALSEKWGYVYGTIGQVLTEAILKQKQIQYPDKINRYIDFIRKNWLGKRTADCVNLIKSYFWWNTAKNDVVYDIKYDKYEGTWMSADEAFAKATEKGDIRTMPDIPGICVRFPGHMGVYIGNGEVIEARGTAYGVVKTKLTDRPWTHWMKYPGIVYIDEMEEYKSIIQKYCEFSYPPGVWEVLDKHPYARDLYKKWAESYSKIPG